MSIPTFFHVHQVPTTVWRILCSVYGVCLSFCVRVASVALATSYLATSVASMDSTFHITDTLTTNLFI